MQAFNVASNIINLPEVSTEAKYLIKHFLRYLTRSVRCFPERCPNKVINETFEQFYYFKYARQFMGYVVYRKIAIMRYIPRNVSVRPHLS